MVCCRSSIPGSTSFPCNNNNNNNNNHVCLCFQLDYSPSHAAHMAVASGDVIIPTASDCAIETEDDPPDYDHVEMAETRSR